MKKALFKLILLTFSLPILSQELAADQLMGEWSIDLRPTPSAEGYFQPFIVQTIKENTFTGTFYGSEVENALINTNWEKIYFAFTTKDATSAYYHSGYLIDGKLYGISYCPNRGFTAPWKGEKSK